MSKPDYEILSAYLDGQLTDEERVRAEQLLEEDAEARRLLEELREVSHTVSALPRHALPADFAERIETSLTVKPRENQAGLDHWRRRFLSGRALAWVAVILVAAFGLNYFFPDSTEQARNIARTDIKEHQNRNQNGPVPGVDQDAHATPQTLEMHAYSEEGTTKTEEGHFAMKGGDSSTVTDHNDVDSIPTLKGGNTHDGVAQLAMDDAAAGESGGLKAKSTNRGAPKGPIKSGHGGDHAQRHVAAPRAMNFPNDPSVPMADTQAESQPSHETLGMSGTGGMGGMSNNAVPPSPAWEHHPESERDLRHGMEGVAGARPPLAAPTPNSMVPQTEGTIDKPTEHPTFMQAPAGEQIVAGHWYQSTPKARPEIIVVCEVEKPAETARAFNRLLAKNQVGPKQIRKLTNRVHTYAAPPGKGEQAQELDSGTAKPDTLRLAKEELMVRVNWDQTVGLLKAVQQDKKQFLSVQANASPGVNLPKPLAPFNRKRSADKVAVQAAVGDAEEKTQAESVAKNSQQSRQSQAEAVEEVKTAEGDAAVVPPPATVEYRIRFIFRQAAQTALD